VSPRFQQTKPQVAIQPTAILTTSVNAKSFDKISNGLCLNRKERIADGTKPYWLQHRSIYKGSLTRKIIGITERSLDP